MKDNFGSCALCGKYEKLSFEHIPPRSALNNKPINIHRFDNIYDSGSKFFGKHTTSHKGFGFYTLCEKCNNSTGAWYSPYFAEFVIQGMKIIQNQAKGSRFICGNYKIRPLNVLKQILTMFMSADHSGELLSQKELADFILNKEAIILPSRYKVYLYFTLSRLKRLLGYSYIQDPGEEIKKWSEINFQPFGYLLTDDSPPAHNEMLDISFFGKYGYCDEGAIELNVPYLPVNSSIIGTY